MIGRNHPTSIRGRDRDNRRWEAVEGECPARLPVPGPIDDLTLLIEISHPFLREGCPDDAAGQIFHGVVVFVMPC